MKRWGRHVSTPLSLGGGFDMARGLMKQERSYRITAAAAVPGQAKDKWFAIKALADGAELRLRGYIGEASSAVDYWTGQKMDTGGMGTLKEFEDALKALGEPGEITVYLTSEGGDFPTAVAISSILARQKARIVCVVDGYAYSAAPVIMCAADEVRAAPNAIFMIHDAEYWSSGCDIESLQEAIKVLGACNSSMAAAFQNKAGGSIDEWMTRMKDTTWMTGAEAKDLGLVDVLLDEVALSAYAPLAKVTAGLKPPAKIRALIDTKPVATPKTPAESTAPMKTTPELIAMCTAHGITLTADSDEAAVTAAFKQITAAAKKKDGEEEEGKDKNKKKAKENDSPKDDGDDTTAAVVTRAVTAAIKPLQEQITAQGAEIKHLKGIKDHGLGDQQGSPTAAADKPAAAGKGGEDEDAGKTPRAKAISAFGKMAVFTKPTA